MVKGVVKYPFTPDEVISQVLIVEERKEYDKQLKEGQIVSEHVYDTFVGYAILKKLLIVSSRDLVFASQFFKCKKTGIVMTPTISIDHPDYPEKKDPVRGIL